MFHSIQNFKHYMQAASLTPGANICYNGFREELRRIIGEWRETETETHSVKSLTENIYGF